MQVEKIEHPKIANHDSSVLDLAFCMDCTGSMGSYIENARNVNISLLFYVFNSLGYIVLYVISKMTN